ncbi:MAG TPA: hypothetical protein VIS09_04790, partial [Streptomyces sp.]
MGLVYLGRHREGPTGSLAAVKTIRAEIADSTTFHVGCCGVGCATAAGDVGCRVTSAVGQVCAPRSRSRCSSALPVAGLIS